MTLEPVRNKKSFSPHSIIQNEALLMVHATLLQQYTHKAFSVKLAIWNCTLLYDDSSDGGMVCGHCFGGTSCC